MNKGYIFDSLKAGLLSAGFSEKEVNLHIQHYTEKFAGMSDDAIALDMERHDGVDGFVSSVIDNRNQILLKDVSYREAVGISNDEMTEEEAAVSDEEKSAESDKEAEDTETRQEPIPEDIPEADATEAVNEESEITEEPEITAEPAEPVASEKPEEPNKTEEPKTPHIEDPMGVYDLFSEQETVKEPDEASPLSTLFGEETLPDDEPEEPVPDFESEHTEISETNTNDVPPEDEDTDEDIRIAASENKSMPLIDEATKQVPVSTGDTVIVEDGFMSDFGEENEQKQDNSRHSRLRDRTYFGPYDQEKLKSFRIKAALLSPFACLGSLLAVAGVFLLYILSVLLIPLFLILMLTICAGGIVVSLVGIIYGVSQIFIVEPVGLYEIGLGLCVLALTVAVSVLIYNFAVRLLPRFVRQMWQPVRFVFYYVIDLYCYQRGEASRP